MNWTALRVWVLLFRMDTSSSLARQAGPAGTAPVVDGRPFPAASSDKVSPTPLERLEYLLFSDPYIELDLTNNVLIWSDEIFRTFEIDPDKFGAACEAFLDAVHPEDRDAVDFAYTMSIQPLIA